MHTIWRTSHSINQRVTESLLKGIPGASVKHADRFDPSKPLNTAIGYGILRGTTEVFHECASRGVDYWEVDRGYFRPAHFDGYYRISLNGMHPKYIDLDLPGDRLEALGINIAPWREGGEYILVCPPTDAVCEFYNLTEAVRNPKIKSDEPIRIREKGSSAPISEDLEGASGVLTYNSNVAVTALQMGIFANCINHPINTWMSTSPQGGLDRAKLFRFLSYCQFTLDEIESGYAWKTVNMIQKEGRFEQD